MCIINIKIHLTQLKHQSNHGQLNISETLKNTALRFTKHSEH